MYISKKKRRNDISNQISQNFFRRKTQISEISTAAMISESESAHIFRGEVEFV